MLTVKQYAAKFNISPARVHQFLREDRIEGAKKVGRDWLIPKEAEFPAYHRVWKGFKRSSDTGTELPHTAEGDVAHMR